MDNNRLVVDKRMSRNRGPYERPGPNEVRPRTPEPDGRGDGLEPDDELARWLAEWNAEEVVVEPEVGGEGPPASMMRQVFVSAVVAALVAASVSYASIRGALFRRFVDVPNLVGLTMDTARTALDQAGLLLVATDELADTAAPPGQIVLQRPLTGSQLRRGESVEVVVAQPPILVKVPSVVGQVVGEARMHLEDAHLTVSRVVEQAHPSLAVGKVISQSVPEGTEVRAGMGLELKVSKGAETVTVPVPAVVGKSLSKAKDLLKQAGLMLGKIHYASDDDHSPGIVLGQEPVANKTLGKGLAVDLIVNSD